MEVKKKNLNGECFPIRKSFYPKGVLLLGEEGYMFSYPIMPLFKNHTHNVKRTKVY